ncbi:YdcH family protein [Thioclava sp. 15-R06ZXC-3]|uniref:YdcH family protein n=1 Tax=Thioclava arctica TaxID=3238301 RepID=A0ABV3TFG7_9RHOB
MSNTPHTLQEEFPQQLEQLHDLKISNAHFAKLLEEYDTINVQVHRAETNVDPVDSLVETELRKKRAAVKDEIARMLSAAAV